MTGQGNECENACGTGGGTQDGQTWHDRLGHSGGPSLNIPFRGPNFSSVVEWLRNPLGRATRKGGVAATPQDSLDITGSAVKDTVDAYA